jgi:YHS domain-containing protein
MSSINDLVSRIDSEFAAMEKSVKEFQSQQVQNYEGKQERLEQYRKVCDLLRDVWTPRIETLAKKFGDKAKLTPRVTPTLREAKLEFKSELADVVLRFTAATDEEVHNLVLDYDLHILPILMKYEKHSQIEFPLDAPDRDTIAKWIDDRIVDFVKTYLSLHKNEYYLKGHQVADPVSGTLFPKYAAAATLDWEGKTYYFIGEETRQEFAAKKGIK